MSDHAAYLIPCTLLPAELVKQCSIMTYEEHNMAQEIPAELLMLEVTEEGVSNNNGAPCCIDARLVARLHFAYGGKSPFSGRAYSASSLGTVHRALRSCQGAWSMKDLVELLAADMKQAISDRFMRFAVIAGVSAFVIPAVVCAYPSAVAVSLAAALAPMVLGQGNPIGHGLAIGAAASGAISAMSGLVSGVSAQVEQLAETEAHIGVFDALIAGREVTKRDQKIVDLLDNKFGKGTYNRILHYATGFEVDIQDVAKAVTQDIAVMDAVKSIFTVPAAHIVTHGAKAVAKTQVRAFVDSGVVISLMQLAMSVSAMCGCTFSVGSLVSQDSMFLVEMLRRGFGGLSAVAGAVGAVQEFFVSIAHLLPYIQCLIFTVQLAVEVFRAYRVRAGIIRDVEEKLKAIKRDIQAPLDGECGSLGPFEQAFADVYLPNARFHDGECVKTNEFLDFITDPQTRLLSAVAAANDAATAAVAAVHGSARTTPKAQERIYRPADRSERKFKAEARGRGEKSQAKARSRGEMFKANVQDLPRPSLLAQLSEAASSGQAMVWSVGAKTAAAVGQSAIAAGRRMSGSGRWLLNRGSAYGAHDARVLQLQPARRSGRSRRQSGRSSSSRSQRQSSSRSQRQSGSHRQSGSRSRRQSGSRRRSGRR